VDPEEVLVFADRVGVGGTIGNAAFYQSMYLGGQGNLLGYRQYRFAGQYMAYNNLEARIRLAQFANYILPGQLGFVGLFDVGRVWQKEDHSNQWHNGVGGGLYYAPAQIALVEFIMSYSSEGWYPTFSIGFRF
jgi:hemolysin activation/secretion protein